MSFWTWLFPPIEKSPEELAYRKLSMEHEKWLVEKQLEMKRLDVRRLELVLEKEKLKNAWRERK